MTDRLKVLDLIDRVPEELWTEVHNNVWETVIKIIPKKKKHKKAVIHEEKIRLTMFFVAKDREALYSQQKQDQLLTSSDHELLTAKFRLKLKKIGKTTRQFRYTP